MKNNFNFDDQLAMHKYLNKSFFCVFFLHFYLAYFNNTKPSGGLKYGNF